MSQSPPLPPASIPEAIHRGGAGPMPQAALPPADKSGRGALLVASGILLSRLMGLVRSRVFAHFLGSSVAAAAFSAALRIPNLLQNLFGEGVLSASFIPVYASLIGKGEREEADRVAGAVFGLLALVTSGLVLLGMVATPLFVETIAGGFKGEARELSIRLVRILFPGTGLLVLSAWCLGILNSHRKFFLSYAAPVLWNFAIIGVLLAFGRSAEQAKLAEYTAYGAVAGSALQFGSQLPSVFRLLGKFRPSLSTASASVRQVLKSFGSVVIGRGVVQLSAYIDLEYASLISPSAFALLTYAQTLALIPMSLFGMAISAAELPAMSQLTGTDSEVAEKLRDRINQGLNRIAFFVVPSSVAFLFLGDLTAGVLFQTGKFHASDTRYVWYLLIGSAVGLLASTMGRLYSSTFYALKDAKTPLYFAVVRVSLTATLAYYSVRFLPAQLGLPTEAGGIGITATTGVAAWIEYLLLRRALAKRIGDAGLARARAARLWGSAAVAAGCGLAVKWALGQRFGVDASADLGWGIPGSLPPQLSPLVTAAAVLTVYGGMYLGLTAALGVPQAAALFRKVLRRR